MRRAAGGVATVAVALAVIPPLSGLAQVTSGARGPTTAAAACAQWDISGTWTTTQGNNYAITWRFAQSGTSITGSAILSAADAARAGYTGTVGSVTGALVQDQLDVVVVWPPKQDGSGSSGEYAGTIVEGATPGRGALSGGQAWDQANPGARIGWSGSGPAKCVKEQGAGCGGKPARVGLRRIRLAGRPVAEYGPIDVYRRIPGLRVVRRGSTWVITGLPVAHVRDRWVFDDCGGSGQIATASAGAVTNLARRVATVGDRVSGLHAVGCPSDPSPVVGVITTGDPRITINGRPIAVPGSSVVTGPTCGTNLGHVQ